MSVDHSIPTSDPTHSENLLSIAIVNWNTRELLVGALASIFDSPPPFRFEVIVVDNDSRDGSVEAVRSGFPQVHVVANASNAGYAEANNQAIRYVGSRYVLLLNPDVLLPRGTLEQAVIFMEARSDAGALGVRQVHPDGSLQRSVRGFPTPLAILWELMGLPRIFARSRFFGAYRMNWFDYTSVVEVDQPMGTFLLLRRAVIERIGMLDEEFPIFFNEVDWCLRCKRDGWRIYFTPDISITHYGGASTSQVGAAMAWESRRGLLQFYAKHYGSALYWPLRLVIAAGSWPHAWLQSRLRRSIPPTHGGANSSGT